MSSHWSIHIKAAKRLNPKVAVEDLERALQAEESPSIESSSLTKVKEDISNLIGTSTEPFTPLEQRKFGELLALEEKLLGQEILPGKSDLPRKFSVGAENAISDTGFFLDAASRELGSPFGRFGRENLIKEITGGMSSPQRKEIITDLMLDVIGAFDKQKRNIPSGEVFEFFKNIGVIH